VTGKKKRDLLDGYEELDVRVPLDDEDAEEILASASVDADAALSRLLQRIDDKEEELRATAYARATEERQRILGRMQPRSQPRSREELLSTIAQMQSRGVELQAMYKNLEEVTDEDLESLVADLELLSGEDEEA
jgi:vacuolar-type H+-ATPase subunit E/Vma4